MAAISLEQFVDQLASSGLMTADDLSTFTESLPADQKPVDAETLAKQLIAAKQLTPFQAQQTWKGKAKHLVLGNYVISDKIGQGGMGMVFKASHKLMKREVALKVLSPGAVKDKTAVRRFLREVEAAAKLTHPNIVAAHDADQSSGTYYLIMEYVEGRDLSVIVKKQGPAKVAQGIDCILQAARGLEYAHKQGVIHRDIKPANLLLDKSGTVKVLDMGLARIEDDGIDAATQAGLTGTGVIMGTIDYMSPEQAEDTKRAGPQADIYSLGASLYFLLVGKPMLEGDTLGKKLKVLMTGVGLPDSISSARSGVSAELDAVFRKMTAFDTKGRYQSMTEVIADLEALKAGGVPSSASVAGIEPVAAVRSEDSAMQSFLNHLGDGTAIAGRTVLAPSDNAASPDTMASSVGEATRPAIKNKTTVTTALQAPQNRKLVIGGGVAACLLLVAIIWGLSGGGDTPPASGGRKPTDVVDNAKPPPLAVAPPKNYALSFDGKDNYVYIPEIQYEPNQPITMEAWVKLSANQRGIGVVIHTHTAGGPVLYFDESGSVTKVKRAWNFRYPGTSGDFSSLENSAIPDRWTHLAEVWNGSRCFCFVNGKRVASAARTKTPWPKSFDAYIGTHYGNPGFGTFHGVIDEVRISETARYTKDFTPQKRFTPDKHTLALYHFDEASGDKLTDHSGNDHHGQIHGATWVRTDGTPADNAGSQ